MPKIFNLGSINLDRTIRLTHFPAPGETISGDFATESLGGKGLNVSVALKRAGDEPVHIGAIGSGDAKMLRELARYHIDTTHIAEVQGASGRAYVFLDDQSENSIVVCAGANQSISSEHIRRSLQSAAAGDWLVLQNETCGHTEALDVARAKGLHVAYMAAPFCAAKVVALIDDIDLLALNETEAAQLEQFSGKSVNELGVDRILVTKGGEGASYAEFGKMYEIAGLSVPVCNTTAAGDTFFGFFLAEYLRTRDPNTSLTYANAAAALAVQREGAAGSIPNDNDVRTMLEVCQ